VAERCFRRTDLQFDQQWQGQNAIVQENPVGKSNRCAGDVCEGLTQIVVREDSPAIRIVEVILALALLGSLFAAGWRIHHRASVNQLGDPNSSNTVKDTELTIALRGDLAAASSVSVELYPVDLTALERQFRENPRGGKQFDDFLARRLKDITPVRASTDGQGLAVAKVSQGNWWLHARMSLANGETLEWRLPLNVSIAQRNVELTRENAYERTKKF